MLVEEEGVEFGVVEVELELLLFEAPSIPVNPSSALIGVAVSLRVYVTTPEYPCLLLLKLKNACQPSTTAMCSGIRARLIFTS